MSLLARLRHYFSRASRPVPRGTAGPPARISTWEAQARASEALYPYHCRVCGNVDPEAFSPDPAGLNVDAIDKDGRPLLHSMSAMSAEEHACHQAAEPQERLFVAQR